MVSRRGFLKLLGLGVASGAGYVAYKYFSGNEEDISDTIDKVGEKLKDYNESLYDSFQDFLDKYQIKEDE